MSVCPFYRFVSFFILLLLFCTEPAEYNRVNFLNLNLRLRKLCNLATLEGLFLLKQGFTWRSLPKVFFSRRVAFLLLLSPVPVPNFMIQFWQIAHRRDPLPVHVLWQKIHAKRAFNQPHKVRAREKSAPIVPRECQNFVSKGFWEEFCTEFTSEPLVVVFCGVEV